MPELPEVECVRRTLAAAITGARVDAAALYRIDFAQHVAAASVHASQARSSTAAQLLQGQHIDKVIRHGKQIAIVGSGGSVACLHLGMTGQVQVESAAVPPPAPDTHEHCRWSLSNSDGRRMLMRFRDPRRFGGIWTLSSPAMLEALRWSMLGPDALDIDGTKLLEALRQTRRNIKCALLDQEIIAGVGNIYADEALFRAGIRPRRSASRLTPQQVDHLAQCIREVLAAAIESGGSTVRDYLDASGARGTFQSRHAVYGRAGQPCIACGSRLKKGVVSQRTTVWCSQCQS